MDFVCKDRQQCLFHSMVCDGVVQCRDGSDEDAAFAGCCEWGGGGRPAETARATVASVGGASPKAQGLVACPVLHVLRKTYISCVRSSAR